VEEIVAYITTDLLQVTEKLWQKQKYLQILSSHVVVGYTPFNNISVK
jgi:hypothetical protein